MAIIRTNWDSPYGPSGSVWKGPRKRGAHVYIDRYDHQGLEELSELPFDLEDRGPSSQELKTADGVAQVLVLLYLERTTLSEMAELSPEEDARKLALEDFFSTHWKKLPFRVRDTVERRLKKG